MKYSFATAAALISAVTAIPQDYAYGNAYQGSCSASTVTVTVASSETSSAAWGGYNGGSPVTITETVTYSQPELVTQTYFATATVTASVIATVTADSNNVGSYGYSSVAVNNGGSYSASPAPAATHKVVVGGMKDAAGKPILRYNPEFVFANPGDIVSFDFRAMNHTVTESTFDNPCVAKEGGFKSGFRPNKENIPGAQIFTLTVGDENPHWVYCGQKLPKPHCEAGMVFAINPKTSGEKTFDNFQKKAIDSGANGVYPPGSGSTATGSDGCSTSTLIATVSTPVGTGIWSAPTGGYTGWSTGVSSSMATVTSVPTYGVASSSIASSYVAPAAATSESSYGGYGNGW